jgi:pyruvate dehydrogenase E2 component (dihydrolipoamide acetyltransferase)
VEVVVPDLGDFADVEVIEVLVRPGDSVAAEQGLITLETDKATMDVPSPAAGKITAVKVKPGDRVSAGSVIATLESGGGEKAATPAAAPDPRPEEDRAVRQPKLARAVPAAGAEPRVVAVPDLGDFSGVEIIDVLVKPGDEVAAEQGVVTLETEKASMDVPAPEAGRVLELKVAVGDKVSTGDPLLLLAPSGAAPAAAPASAPSAPAAAPASAPSAPARRRERRRARLRARGPLKRGPPRRFATPYRARRRRSARRTRARRCASSRASSESSSAACAAPARKAA